MGDLSDTRNPPVSGARIFLLSLGLFVLRAGSGGLMIYGHGLAKLTGFAEKAERFADPFGLGGPISLGLATFAEFFCSILLILGLFTRLAAIPLLVTMLTAVFFAHAADPYEKKELALVYLVPFVSLVFTGPGRFSLDHLLWGRAGKHR